VEHRVSLSVTKCDGRTSLALMPMNGSKIPFVSSPPQFESAHRREPPATPMGSSDGAFVGKATSRRAASRDEASKETSLRRGMPAEASPVALQLCDEPLQPIRAKPQ
jgi:hypothetical protein